MGAVRSLAGLSIALCAAATASAQIGAAGGGIAVELARYLQLTPAQGTSINQSVSDWTAHLQKASSQADQLRSSILTETGKDVPDAGVLGGYYVQLEMICRQTTAERTDLLRRTRAVLTDAQLTRLQALDDALQLMPRVVEAQRAGLLSDWIVSAPPGLPAGQITVPLTFPATTPTPLPGCLAAVSAQPEIVPALRRGPRP